MPNKPEDTGKIEMVSRVKSQCLRCRGMIKVGDKIIYYPNQHRAIHKNITECRKYQ